MVLIDFVLDRQQLSFQHPSPKLEKRGVSSIRIHQRFHLISLGFSILVVIVLTIGGGRTLHRQQCETAELHAQCAVNELLNHAGHFLSLRLHDKNFPEFEKLCAEIVRNDRLLTATAVYDDKWRLLFKTSGGGFTANTKIISDDFFEKTVVKTLNTWFAAQPVMSLEKKISGYVVVFINEEAVLRNTADCVARLMVSSFILLSIMLIIQNRLFRSSVGTPLAELIHTADTLDIDSGEQLAILRRKSDASDLGRVYGTFYRLLERLFDARNELVKQNERLESIVRMRTERLERVNAVLANDIKRRVELEHKLLSQASTDFLTGLLNRHSFEIHLRDLIFHAKLHNWCIAVLFVDLDQFKTINDTMGHSIGDKLLVHVARSLSSCIRKTDIAARLGGDEFVIVLSDLPENPGMRPKLRKKFSRCWLSLSFLTKKNCMPLYQSASAFFPRMEKPRKVF